MILGDGFLSLHPIGGLGRVGVFEPAIGIGDGLAVQDLNGVVTPSLGIRTQLLVMGHGPTLSQPTQTSGPNLTPREVSISSPPSSAVSTQTPSRVTVMVCSQ